MDGRFGALIALSGATWENSKRVQPHDFFQSLRPDPKVIETQAIFSGLRAFGFTAEELKAVTLNK